MTHKNYYTFKASSNYDLGFMMGQKFSNEAKNAVLVAKKDNWKNKLDIGRKLLDITQEYFPQFIDELKGYATGAGVEFIDLWTISIEGDAERKTSAKCTNIITNEGKLIGHNEDAERPGLENSVCIVKKTLGNLTTFEIYYYNTLGGNSVGISSFGYAHALNTLFFTGNKLGIPKNVIARYLLETNNPDVTIKKVLNFPRASGYNHNIISKSGKIWNLELTADKGILINPVSPFAHSNHCLNIESDINNAYGTISRLEFAQNNTKDKMTIEELIKLQEDTSKGSSESLFNERTIGKMIIDFDTKIVKVWLLREKELGWVDYSLDFMK
jgi:predicted choloylglycine hydrolase